MIYNQILSRFQNKEKQLAYLIDPDKFDWNNIEQLKVVLKQTTPDLLLIGGSLISVDTSAFVKELKAVIDMPVVLYPGSSVQVCKDIDAVLFLSLISGRNPEFLISHHVAAAPQIKANNIEAISTGYMLVDGGSNTSVQYISQTIPIPSDKNDIAVATALAGQYLGMKLIYMDAGSGAENSVSGEMIKAVKSALDIPLMIGGGIRSVDAVKRACKAGADIIVVGNVLEQDISLLADFYNAVKSINA
ncbi:geranylgeranylglyceryl/heptaprenylglyceryl phosphate synthase [Carboxylicivirga sp. A043]|uniref:geranylgeranylglyceryl/heptaprenylglyceryl phosphate synthase n=1 Tax=Carboxylicivirga litoralis TaxID=2816963 RepID=UPI0021CB63FE|nr:geranylgeranylglyceryl/heptaprenylglyceryl phosphate synthase [Carboxylicivirga sp. A043]MCU4154807.1 geranylgeranylglyceryl/heptaprenylglyceryl phosphate synthase [Carboxylicivirga sp. A043]